jgi:hypothetical protein
MLMNTRDDLIIKLAALQVKYYGDFDPEFIKEAVDDVGAHSVGANVPPTMWHLMEEGRRNLLNMPPLGTTETVTTTTTTTPATDVAVAHPTVRTSTPADFNPLAQVGPAPSITADSAPTTYTPPAGHNASNAPTLWDALGAVGRGLGTVGGWIGQGLRAAGQALAPAAEAVGHGIAAGGRWLGHEISEGVERARQGIHNMQTAHQAANTARQILREDPNAHILATSKGPFDKGVFYTSASTAALTTALATLLARKKAKNKESR